jgi:hypothetical protein
MRELEGYVCRADFFGDHATGWPFPGFPAWVVVLEVDMPMVKMRGYHGDGAKWVNAALIKTISAVQKAEGAPFDTPAPVAKSQPICTDFNA